MEFTPVLTCYGPSKYYEISKCASLRVSQFEMIIPTRIVGKRKKFYKQVQLLVSGNLKWFYLHRLVLRSFRGKPTHPKRHIVDHRDSNSLNNNLYNLRYCTIRANNLNRKCGLFQKDGVYYPKIAQYIHYRYGTEDAELASIIRQNLVEKYVRWANKFPNTKNYPHEKISKF